MAKRFDDLWERLTSYENLDLAFRRARKGKRAKPPVAVFEFRQEEELVKLRDELRSHD